MEGSSEASDYRLVCRTCLASEAEFYKLDACITGKEGEPKTSFMDCLKYCTRLDNVAVFPMYICTQCSGALQVAYRFMQNAVEAHDVLRQKLCPAQKNNGRLEEPAAERVMRYRCKICYAKVETKKSLKEHLSLHMDAISFSCHMCPFTSNTRVPLTDHYNIIHGITPDRELLRPKTGPVNKLQASHQGTQLLDNLYTQMEQMQHPKTDRVLPLRQTKPQTHIHQQAPQFQQSFEQQLQEQYEYGQQQQQPRQQSLLLPLPPRTEQTQSSLLRRNIDMTDTAGISSTEVLDFNNELNVANEMCIGNEFIVMEDGTVEEVMGNGVVIEYINTAADGVTLENGLVLNNLNNIVQLDPNTGTINDVIQMDVDDMIIEDSASTEDVQENYAPLDNGSQIVQDSYSIAAPQHTLITTETAEVPQEAKKFKCKVCADSFATQDKLKTHMLSHKEIPHFFCDKCSFYTFFKIDLTQHYKTKHKVQPTLRQLQPKNKTREESRLVYTCDLCLFETNVKVNLRKHYADQHSVTATDVQLRPTVVESDIESLPVVRRRQTRGGIKPIKPDYPSGLNCKKCNKTFYWRNKLKEHYKEHNLEENAALKLNNFHELKTQTDSALPLLTDMELETALTTPSPSSSYCITSTTVNNMAPMPQQQLSGAESTPNEQHNISAEIDFDFNGDALFEEFDDEEREENDDLQTLLLTSDDDFEDILEEQGQESGATTRPYCVHCNKKFYSQYQFENHMFVHRGLAPYRCEMCTNLYSKKRALIRHYQAVHKNIPTRDMIQAKGDKVSVDNTSLEDLNLQPSEVVTLMCAKCPYESTVRSNLEIHLNTIHGVSNDSFIIQKLPFECPRCIRSYANRDRLIRHLERSHSTLEILQQKQTSNTQAPTHIAAPTAAAANVVNNMRPNSGLVELNAIVTEASLENATIHCQFASVGDDNYSSQLDAVAAEVETTTTVATTATQAQPSFECAICRRSYKTLRLLQHHQKRHTARTFRCTQCPKTFITRNDLQNHRMLHGERLPYPCEVCGRHFGYKHHLTRHMDVQHLGKRHPCMVVGCGRLFASSCQLKLHACDHEAQLPSYKCPYCERYFKKRGSIRDHCLGTHNISLTEADCADIFLKTTGHTNPYDLTVAMGDGQMLRRSDLEANLSQADVVDETATAGEAPTLEQVMKEAPTLQQVMVEAPTLEQLIVEAPLDTQHESQPAVASQRDASIYDSAFQ